MNHLLITSAGKRVGLVKAFQETLARFYPDGRVYTVDMNPEMAPACIVSDGSFKVNRVTSDDYIPNLLQLCKDNGIKVIIPTIDTELLILAKNKALFEKEGILIVVSDFDFVQMCRDKRNTNCLFTECGIKIPRPIDINQPTFPVFAKPYDGSLSQGIHLLRSASDITEEISSNPKLMFMEYIDKSEYTEFTVDMYFGRDNKLKSLVPRERIEIRAGEINKGKTCKNAIYYILKEKIAYLEGVSGTICMQVFYRESDEDVIAIEINPRFGGGYTMAYAAKANFPEMIIREYMLEEQLDFNDKWIDNLTILRYDSDLVAL